MRFTIWTGRGGPTIRMEKGLEDTRRGGFSIRMEKGLEDDVTDRYALIPCQLLWGKKSSFVRKYII